MAGSRESKEVATTTTAKELIEFYQLQPHPEGGFYKRTYCAEGKIFTSSHQNRFRGGGERFYSTGIYYLLVENACSRLHRIASDEMWHYYLGGPITIVEIFPSGGGVKQTVLGPDFRSGQVVQYVVPAGVWFGSFPNPGTSFAFVGCTVAPGFDFEDFEIANKSMLLEQYPQATELIERLS